jgi:hypothetical protein
VLTPSAATGESFDVDGNRLAWVATGCQHAAIVISPLGQGPVSGPVSDRCSLAMLKPPQRSGGRLHIAASCGGFDPTCQLAGVVVWTGSRTRRAVVVARQAADTTADAQSMSVRLTTPGRRLLARRAHPRVFVMGYIGDNPITSTRRDPRFAEKRNVATTIR